LTDSLFRSGGWTLSTRQIVFTTTARKAAGFRYCLLNGPA